ncbi:MAG: head-tail adaptor protein [Rhodobacteraceae bacterium]|nr:head-tail adaptor protein [Paracoccaceae bacterium]
MTASKLDRKAQFHRRTLTQGAFGMEESWAPHGQPVWALRADITDGERWRAGEVAASVTTRFQVRSTEFTRGIDPRDRIECEGELFEIVGVKQASQYGRRQLIEITASRRTDQG